MFVVGFVQARWSSDKCLWSTKGRPFRSQWTTPTCYTYQRSRFIWLLGFNTFRIKATRNDSQHSYSFIHSFIHSSVHSFELSLWRWNEKIVNTHIRSFIHSFELFVIIKTFKWPPIIGLHLHTRMANIGRSILVYKPTVPTRLTPFPRSAPWLFKRRFAAPSTAPIKERVGFVEEIGCGYRLVGWVGHVRHLSRMTVDLSEELLHLWVLQHIFNCIRRRSNRGDSDDEIK